MDADIIVLGGGIAGLLLASELAATCTVIVLEQKKEIPLHKYWLTSGKSLDHAPALRHCVGSTYSSLDFIAYDDTTARIGGTYCLWDTQLLINALLNKISSTKGTLLTGKRFYSFRYIPGGVAVRAGREELSARLLVDCMGYNSPFVAAKRTSTVTGFYILHGAKLILKKPMEPIGLHNVVFGNAPAYFELFPTNDGEAHGVMILPARHINTRGRPGSDFRFLLEQSHYSTVLELAKGDSAQSLFGIIPVGRLLKRSLDNIIFFGESGLVNPAASATGFTRMLNTYQDLAEFIVLRLRDGRLDSSSLAPPSRLSGMSTLNRSFQEILFENILDFTSDDFRELVIELSSHDPEVLNELIFAEYRFTPLGILRLLASAAPGKLRRLRRNTLRAVMRGIRNYSGSLLPSW